MTVTYAPALIAARTVATSCHADRSSPYRGNNRHIRENARATLIIIYFPYLDETRWPYMEVEL